MIRSAPALVCSSRCRLSIQRTRPQHALPAIVRRPFALYPNHLQARVNVPHNAPHSTITTAHHTSDIMAIQVVPLPVPPTADAAALKDFGREVKGVNPGALNPEQFKEVHDLLYKVR